MAELALSLDMEFAQDQPAAEKWQMGSTIAFALSVSAGLWLAVGVVAYFVF